MDLVINSSSEVVPPAEEVLVTQGGFYLNALAVMGYDPNYPPLGDLLRRTKLLQGQWMLVSPMHWEATHNDAMIVASGDELGLDDQYSRIWFAEISQFLAENNLPMVYIDAHNWLINVDKRPPINSPSVRSVQHQSLMPVLKAMDESMYWQRLFTEIQMFMSSHPLNSRRDLDLPVNGLWFWGAGCLSDTTDQTIMTADPVIQDIYKDCLPLDWQSRVDSKAVILIHQFEPSLLPVLMQFTKMQTVRWYWNNTAYHTWHQRWWQRLWRR